MFFKFKKKEITLDCFTTDPFAFEHAKICNGVKMMPEWWSSLPSHNKHHTMKTCMGFTRLFSRSIVIPSWFYLEINVSDNKEHKFEWRSGSFLQMEEHSHEQSNFHFKKNNFGTTKILSPWFFRTNKMVEFMWYDLVWCRNNMASYTVLPGIIDFYNQFETHINLAFQHTDKNRKITITAGEPLVSIIPITEEKITLKHHLIDEKEKEKFALNGRFGLDMASRLSNLYSVKKNFLEKNRKCPFQP